MAVAEWGKSGTRTVWPSREEGETRMPRSIPLG